MEYFTVCVEWGYNSSAEGTHSWAGWAEDAGEAERLCRNEMYDTQLDEELEEFSQKDADDYGGVLIYCFTGANIYAAPEAVQKIEEYLETGECYELVVALNELLNILRPPMEKSE